MNAQTKEKPPCRSLQELMKLYRENGDKLAKNPQKTFREVLDLTEEEEEMFLVCVPDYRYGVGAFYD